MTVRPVVSRRDRKRFLDFPYRHYKDDEHWVAPLRLDVAKTLNKKKNPFFEHSDIQLFLATDSSNRVLGRIAAIENRMHLRKYEDGTGFIGFFESVDDQSVADALFDAAKDWLTGRGLTGARGPTNPSMNDVSGLLVDGFDRYPAIMMPYNKLYYESLFLAYGFERVMTMWSYFVHDRYVDRERMRRGSSIVRRRNPTIRVRQIDLSRFDEEAAVIREIYNEAWSDNWGHVPMTENEFRHLAKEMKQVIDPRLVHVVEDQGTPVAFSIALPDLNQALRHVRNGRLLPFGLPRLLAQSKFGGIQNARTALMGVRKGWQGKGLDIMLHFAAFEDGRPGGYCASEMGWLLESNEKIINTIVNIGGVKDKEYAMFEKRFDT